MPETKISLDAIQIQSPCSASWDAMEGDDVRRFCASCALEVHNLSEMSRREAEALIGGLGRPDAGRVCVQMQRAAIGRVVTREYRKRSARFRRRAAYVGLRMLMGLAGASVVLLGGTGVFASRDSGWFNKMQQRLGWITPTTHTAPLRGSIAPGPAVAPPPAHPEELWMGEAQVIMGDVTASAPPPEPDPTPAPPIRGRVALPSGDTEASTSAI